MLPLLLLLTIAAELLVLLLSLAQVAFVESTHVFSLPAAGGLLHIYLAARFCMLNMLKQV